MLLYNFSPTFGSHFTPYGGGSLPSTTTKTKKNYNVYLIKAVDGTDIILCANKEIDFTKEFISVNNDYSNLRKDVKQQFEEVFDDLDEIYVLYYQETNYMYTLFSLLSIIVIILLIWSFLRYSKLIQKNSKLGKAISKLGEYKEIVADINIQAKDAVYNKYSRMICKDYFIIYSEAPSKNTYTHIIPIENIKEVTSQQKPEYYDVIEISVIYSEDGEEKKYVFDVYNKEDERIILRNLGRN